MPRTASRSTPVTVTRYFDEVVARLSRAGVDVAEIAIDLSPSHPMSGQLITDGGPVLRWREDLGWSTGRRSAGPAAHPGEVAGLIDQA